MKFGPLLFCLGLMGGLNTEFHSAQAADASLPPLDRRLEPARARAEREPAQSRQRRVEAEALLRSRVPRAQIERGPVSGGARWIGSPTGFLTGPNGGGGAMRGAPALADMGLDPADEHRVVKSFIREHAGIFGHDDASLEGARVQRDSRAAHNGVRSTTWQQHIDGLPVHRATLTAHVTRNGELISLGSEMLPAPAAAADPAPRRRLANSEATVVNPATAWVNSAASLGYTLDPAQITPLDPPQGAERIQQLSAPGWTPVRVRLIWLPMDSSTVRLCWRVWLMQPARRVGYELFVDAESGEVIWRRGVTEDASAPAGYRVYTTESPTPFSPGFSTPVTNQPPVVSRTLLNITSVDATASPEGWIPVGENALSGNNTRVRYYEQTSENSWASRAVNGSPSRVFDFPLDLTKSPTTRVKAASANAFYWVNWAHDRFHKLGFNEANRNCQHDNFGRGGVGGDAVSVYVNDPFSEDNAGMTTWDEGGSPEMDLGVYTGPDPDRETALNAETILHEYGHAVSNRLVGDGTGLDSDSVQSRGMGEGWSDFFALALTSSSGDSLHGTYPYGAYTALQKWGTDYMENYYSGTRRYPYTTDMSKNPLTFKDIDPEQADPHIGIPINSAMVASNPAEVHAQGEVWCSMLWEARASLIQKHGFAVGNQLILQLVTDGLNFSPNNPNFATARNSIMLADAALTGGANLRELWAAFAKRGLGTQAKAPVSTTTEGVIESYDSLDDLSITPIDTTEVTGPVGGPFKPSSRTFTLKNDSNGPLPWRARAEPPLELSSTGGVLLPDEARNLSVSVNAGAAGSLPAGGHSFSVYFTNSLSGTVLRRIFAVVIGIKQPPTERFASADVDPFDLSGRSLWFEPVEGGSHYEVCRSLPSPESFPVNPALSHKLDFTNTFGVVVALTNGVRIPFYGVLQSEFEIRLDGSIVPGAEDSDFEDYLGYLGHFSLPRISGLRQNYDSTQGRISWRQTATSLVATWENIKLNGGSTRANFQMELLFDGRIRVTFLDTGVKTGITGLSPGGEIPPLFVDTDLSTSPSCTEPVLGLKLPGSVTEGGLLTAKGFVSVTGGVPRSDLVIQLSASDAGEINVPNTVTIPRGSSSVEFSLSAVNDSARDGSQVVFITASRPGYTSASHSLKVHDNESAVLTLSLPSSRTEGGGIGFGTLTMSAPAGALVGIELKSTRPDLLSVPPLVFIPAGQTSSLVELVTPDNNRIEGPRSVLVTAAVQNWTGDSDNVIVLDNDTTELTLISYLFRNESDGTVTNGATVQIDGILQTNLPVLLVSDDESEIRTPLFGGVIPAGGTNVTFPLFIQDDGLVDGLVLVRLRAIAPSFTPGTNSVFVVDNDGPPEPYNPDPPDGSTNVPPHTDLSWGHVEGDLILNGGFESGDLSGWTLETTGTGTFVVNSGSYDPQSSDGPLPPLAGAHSALSDQAGAGRQALHQDVLIPAGATSVILHWTDRIRSHGGVFGASHGFRVELRSTNNALQALLFSTSTDHPPVGPPTARTADLSGWRGEWVRVAFVEQDSGGYLNVHLDEIRLLAPSVAPTTFDIHFGTDPTPDASERLGSTSTPFWSLPPLLPGTTYYWQIKSRRNSSTNAGPIWSFTTRGNALLSTLVASNSTWRYLATGSNPGSSWNDPGFNDSAWLSGPGKLGFGGDGENTVVTPSSTRVTTFGFRRTFQVQFPNAVLGLQARMIRDDGAAVYLNGNLVWVDNLPSRFTWTNEAVNALDFPEERQWITNTFNPSLLVTGQNLLAVEVHQDPGRALVPDMGFAFELRGIYDDDNHPPWVELTQPASFAAFQQPALVPLAAVVSDTSTFGTPVGVSRVDFFADGAFIGQDIIAPYSFTWSNAPAGYRTLTAVVTDAGGLTSTSTPVHVLITPPPGQVLAGLIPQGSVWDYRDNGLYPGIKWAQPGYDSSRGNGWKRGPAQLGYGDGDESTVVGFGGRQLTRHITTWFRREFTQPADLSALSMRVLRDDGVVLYLNGKEIFRNNLPPSGVIVSNTLATVALSGSAENAWIEVPINAPIIFPMLKPGVNLIAAEVHQSSANSPDLSFDLELAGVGNPPPVVTLTAPAPNTIVVTPASVQLTAAASDPYGGVSAVQFFRNGVPMGNDPTAPYGFTWTSPPVGVHTLTAVATDILGVSGVSTAVQLTILGPVALQAQALPSGMIELTWPAAATGYLLESTPSLQPPITWSPVEDPAQIVGAEFRLNVPSSEPQRYYRLRNP